MKIAIITDDSQTISAHFGRAQFYEVFTIEDGQIVSRERRPKANHSHFSGEHEHHSEQHGTDPASERRHGLMADAIRDCQVVLVRGMGMGAFNSLTASGIRPVVTDVASIESAVQSYLAGTLIDHPERLH